MCFRAWRIHNSSPDKPQRRKNRRPIRRRKSRRCQEQEQANREEDKEKINLINDQFSYLIFDLHLSRKNEVAEVTIRKLVRTYRFVLMAEIIKGRRNMPVYYIWFSLYHSYEYIKSRSSFLRMHPVTLHSQSLRSKTTSPSTHQFWVKLGQLKINYVIIPTFRIRLSDGNHFLECTLSGNYQITGPCIS